MCKPSRPLSKADLKSISPHVWKASGKKLIFNNKELSHINYVIKKSRNKFDIISHFSLNAYLAGVVAKEMPLTWPLEALKAQAVIARSYALAKIAVSRNKLYHVDGNQMDQVFAVTNSKKAQMAVFLTDQMVLKFYFYYLLLVHLFQYHLNDI